MFASNAYVIRHARPSDQPALRTLAQLDSQPALDGRILIGEIGGRPAAAVSLADGRAVADPFQRTAQLTPLLRLRARALAAAEQVPSLRARIRAGVRVPQAAAA